MSNGRYSLMGPAVLITVGTVFLIHEMRPDFGMGRLWPVILIVIGIVRLLEAGSGRCEPGSPGAPGNPPAASGPASSNPTGTSSGSGTSGVAPGSSGS